MKEIEVDGVLIEDWVRDSKDIIFPEVMVGIKKMIADNVDEVKVLLIKYTLDNKQADIDFSVTRSGSQDSLDKILEWAENTEQYELCKEVVELKTKL